VKQDCREAVSQQKNHQELTTTVQPAGAGKQKNFEEKLRNVKKLKKTDSVRSETP